MTIGHLGPDGEVQEEVGCRIMTPVHLLIAAAQSPGPVADLVARQGSSPLLQAAGLIESPGPSGVSADPRHGQAWSSAEGWALELDQRLEPEHLVAALVEQADPQVLATLAAAGIDAAELKNVTLAAVGLSPSTICPLRPLPPAGMAGMPALPLAHLPPDAWSDLSSRQLRLPLHRIRRKAQWHALLANEHRAAGRILESHDLTPDERQSLLVHHRSAVEALLADSAPDVHAQVKGGPRRRRERRRRRHRRYRRLWGVAALLEGWLVWFGNRRANLLRRWYRLTMPRH